MADPIIAPFCPECGNPLAAGVLQGMCPRCLMAVAAHETQPAVSRTATVTLEQISSVFPQLEIVEMIGQGGMGAVFKVRQPKLDRFAALKLLPQSLAADPAFAGRFEREARLLAKLSHPNIVSVYDYGQAGEFFYLLMEYVDGVNLRQAMRASRFEPQQALAIVPKICEALQYAHDEGVLHRDIKPENILLDAKGRVKLVDFGIAKLAAEADFSPTVGATSAAPYTQAGAALGTPDYMAPEQHDHPSQVDHRADIYSLGVVFYELLTGELPAVGLVRPSQKSGADPRVDAIVQQALEKERDRRQHSAGEVRTQVETLVGALSFPTRVSPQPLGYHNPQPQLSRLAVIGACCSLPLFVGIFLAYAVHQLTGPQVGPTLEDWWVRLTVLPLGALAPFATTILGWMAVAKIRRSDGKLYGLPLALFDGLLFPLLALDLGLLFVSGLSMASIPHSFWARLGPMAGKFAILILGVVTSVVADTWVVRFVCAKVNEKERGPAGSRPTFVNSSLAGMAAAFALLSGVVALIAWIEMPTPLPVIVWGILVSAVLAVVLAIPVRSSRLGKTTLIGAGIQIAVWCIIAAVFPHMSSGGAAPPSIADFHYLAFEADAATVDNLIPSSQRKSAVALDPEIARKWTNTAVATRYAGDFTVRTRGDTLTNSQVAEINPATLDALRKAINQPPGLLVDQTVRVSPNYWNHGMADSWSYSRADGKQFGSGIGLGFLGFRRSNGQDQVHIDCRVSDDIDLNMKAPGKQTELAATLFYEGNAPQHGALAFLVPFFRKDDSPHYLVMVYEITVGSTAPLTPATTQSAITNVNFGPILRGHVPATHPAAAFVRTLPSVTLLDIEKHSQSGIEAWRPDGSPLTDNLSGALLRADANAADDNGRPQYVMSFLVSNPPSDETRLGSWIAHFGKEVSSYGPTTGGIEKRPDLKGTLYRVAVSFAKPQATADVGFGIALMPRRDLLVLQGAKLEVVERRGPFAVPRPLPKVTLETDVDPKGTRLGLAADQPIVRVTVEWPPDAVQYGWDWNVLVYGRDGKLVCENQWPKAGHEYDLARPEEISKVFIQGRSYGQDYHFVNFAKVPLLPGKAATTQ
jgi:tRNA A-37 threonylcarbamoyl transferase component Bud32